MPAPAAEQQQQQQQQPSSNEFRSLGLRLHTDSPCISYVFIKHHKPKENEAVIHNAVYVTGLPLGLDEVSLEAVFRVFGPIVNVVVHPTKRSAAVVYESSEAVSQALSHAGTGQVIDFPLPVPDHPVGLKAWVAQHKAQRPGNAVLQQQLDDWIDAHEAAEAAREKARQAAMAEDGWTVVVRSKGRKRAREVGGVSSVTGGIAQAAAAAARAAADAKQAKQADNFYRFQQRDKRRSELVELRQKFEEGRTRLAALKAARHFKPR